MWKAFDFFCFECGYGPEEHLVDGGVDSNLIEIKCPNCDHPKLSKVWTKAPLNRVGGEGSDRSIAAMKESFRQRFVKKEMPDLQEKHGKLFGDSVRSAAATRIKKGEAPT